MMYRSRWTGVWALLLVVVFAACSDSPAGPGAGPGYTPERIPQPNTGPITLHDNVVVIDSTVLRMVSSQAQIAAGKYRFDVIGSPVPLIEAGDVVAGPEGLGFMGIATSISYGTQVLVQTTQASLSDIIEEGSFSISDPLALSIRPPPPGSAAAALYSLAPGVSSSGRLFDLENVDLCEIVKLAGVTECPEWVSLTLPSGYVDFTPSIDFDFEAQASVSAPVKHLKSVIKGDLVFDVSAKAVASQEFSIDGDAVLVGIPVPVPLPFGLGAIIKVTAVVKLIAGYEANANVEARVQSGIHMEAGVEVGGEYNVSSGWSAIWNDTLDVSAKETTWAAQGNGDVRVYVRPEVQLVVASIDGPFAGLEPYLKAYGAVGTEECRVRLTRAMDADVVLTASYANYSLPSHVEKWPGTETELLNIPCPIGHLKVLATTSGSSPDTDGYTVTLDGIDAKPIHNNGSVMYSPLPPTVYNVELTDMAENCSVTNNPREINVSEGDTTLVSFPVVCGDPVPATGAIKVNTMTTGQDDGYSVVVDGDVAGAMPIGTDGTVTFESLAAGDHTVELTGFGSSCVVSGDNPRTVAVADILVETDFQVDCGLTVHAMTTGSDPDPDGYEVIVDGGAPAALADINGSLWLEIAPGMHSVELSGLADGCTVAGDNPRDVTAPGETTFDVACDGTSGAVITYVLGSQIWGINPDGTGDHQIADDPNGFGWPTWSPDGSRLAFTRVICGTGCAAAVFTSDPDGSNVVQVTTPADGVYDNRPRWSADGSQFVFYRQDTSCQPATCAFEIWSIWTVNSDGTGAASLLAGNGADPALDVWLRYAYPTWTPDGRIVFLEAFTDRRDPGNIIEDSYVTVVDADGSGATRLTAADEYWAHELTVSPDGTKIMFRRLNPAIPSHYDLMVMDSDGSDLTNMSNGLYQLFEGGAEWSPHGSQIAYDGQTSGDSSSRGIWVMDSDGSNRNRLTSGGFVSWRTLP